MTKLSCNGCRVLRKGCSDSCSIRPCLQWIKSPDAQSNATLFLAKFYGRAGLLNLIDAAAEDHHLQQRPAAVFRSLLYEACGRIVNPVYGSVGLLWSGNWHLCQAAVEAVLKGAPIVRISDDDAAAAFAATPADLLHLPPHNKDNNKAYYDIRHVSDGKSNSNKKKKRTSSSACTCSNNNKKPKHRRQQGSAVSDDDHQQHDNDDDQEQEASAEAAGSHVSQADHNNQQPQEVEQQQQQSTRSKTEADEKEQLLGLDLSLALGLAPPPTSSGSNNPPAATGRCTTDAEPAFLGLRFL